MNDRVRAAVVRIEVLKAERPIYTEILEFFKQIIQEKEDYKKSLERTLVPVQINEKLAEVKLKEGFPLIPLDEIKCNYPLMREHFLKLLANVKERVGDAVRDIESTMEAEKDCMKRMIQEALRQEPVSKNSLLTFILNETVNPLIELYASFLRDMVREGMWTRGYCPICGGKPFVGVLRGDEGKRWLLCSVCSSEWPFMRMECPYCGNNDQKKLSYFMAEEEEGFRVEVCDACKSYIKTIDERKAGIEIIPYLENIATLHLDMAARNRGYRNEILLIPGTTEKALG
ncbi:MAG: formate dehydrogenase accessory protein FdhE [Deltaproteobacteria bacterium]|nr:formate dehydrogenase accessory protein FdhE [Deltaproteobacteria bacterium]